MAEITADSDGWFAINLDAIELKGPRMMTQFSNATKLAAALLLTVACVTARNADADENAVDAKAAKAGGKVIDIGSNRELFVDEYLIDNLDGARMALHHPRNEGPVMKFDKPWEGFFCLHFSVIKDGDLYRMFYRGADGDDPETDVVCVAESNDGKTWIKPELGLFEVNGTRENNVVHANHPRNSKNLTSYAVFLDTRPGVPKDERYKATATAGTRKLYGLVSSDGIHWRQVKKDPILTYGKFDSSNVAFWSDAEQCYLCYFRIMTDKGFRWIARARSKDFLNWGPREDLKAMHKCKPAPIEHIYMSQMHPYFRAPQIYIAPAARFMTGRQVIGDAELKQLGLPQWYAQRDDVIGGTSDSVLMTSRGGNVVDRTFMEGFIRNEIGPNNWVSRSNYPAWHVVQTGPAEMSFYVTGNYAQPTIELRRFSMRLDGFASIQAGYDGGRMLTRPFTFKGGRLALNFATSTAGDVRVEIQDADGKPVPGFTLADSAGMIGNEIERVVSWKGKTDVGLLAGRPIRLLFELKDADLFAIRFQ